MGMKYYALFFDGNTYIENCLLLLRYICKPSSNSLPHITVRIFKDNDKRALETENRIINRISIIEPGQFNFDKRDIPGITYVVYLRCESEELEGVEYKPTYPQSRLHLTIYEGEDYYFAEEVFNILQLCRWHLAVEYPQGKKLTQRKLGSKPQTKPNIREKYVSIFDESYELFEKKMAEGGNEFKLNKLREIIKKLNEYIKSKELIEIASVYSRDGNIVYSDEGLDNQQEEIDLKDGQFVLKKPCRDNIYITPPEYARDMAVSGIQEFAKNAADSFDNKIRFADSAIGTGSLYRALLDEISDYNESNNSHMEIIDAFGIDIDEKMAKEASMRYRRRKLRVELGDALNARPDRKECCNLMMVNPPFNQHREIPKEYKSVIRDAAERITGIQVSEQSGLFIYYVLIMHDWLKTDGIGVWLLPTFFMQTRYGQGLKEYLLNNVNLLRVHIYDEVYEQFFNAHISTSVVVFQKSNTKNDRIRFSFGRSISKPDRDTMIMRRDISIRGNWRNIFNIVAGKRERQLYDSLQNKQCNTHGRLFGDYFEIKRGIATGANSFFVMSREEAKEIRIPDCVVKPVLPKARFLHERIVEGDKKDGFPLLDTQMVLIDTTMSEEIIEKEYPEFYNYLQRGKRSENGTKAVVERTLVSSRKPWYSQEKRDVPLFLLTYMGRRKKEDAALFFILNRSNAVALNTYLLLYPREELKKLLENNPRGEEYVLDEMQKLADSISENSRIYAGGLRKIEPSELYSFPLDTLDFDVIRQLRNSRCDGTKK